MNYSIERITFKKVESDQLNLLTTWLKKPYIREYWGDGGKTIPDFKKFAAAKKSFFQHYFASYNQRPIAYLMTSIIRATGDDFAKWREKTGKTLTFDFLIGEEEFLGVGFSHLIITKFIEDVCSEAAAIITDPEARNERAIHAYEKAGFVKVGNHYPNEGNWAEIHHIILKKKIEHKLVNK